MTTTSKKLLILLAALLVGIALTVSCSKAPPPETKTGKKDAKATAAATKAAKTLPLGKSSLSAARNGQSVILSWQADLAGAETKKIEVSRSSTGKTNARKGIATLKPGAITYKDTLPDENAYSYWVKLDTPDGKFLELGPARVDIDKAGSSRYVKLEDKYKISITRTDDMATLKWDFPEDEYAGIQIIRAPHAVSGPFNRMRMASNAAKTAQAPKAGNGGKGNTGGVTSVISSLERKSQYTDPLKNPNAEYWYWFRITLKSGTIIDRGPIKAEYADH